MTAFGAFWLKMLRRVSLILAGAAAATAFAPGAVLPSTRKSPADHPWAAIAADFASCRAGIRRESLRLKKSQRELQVLADE
jgi:hypothetical protein